MSAESASSSSTTGLSARLRASVLPLWRRQAEHPFVVALGDGSLPRANFEFYIRQDALFLDVLAKCFAYAATRSDDHAEMEQFGRLLLNTLLVEQELHRRYGERFGLTPAAMAATPMAPTNYAYTRHLLAVAATGTLAEILTAMLPCAWIYAEIGTALTQNKPPAADHPYADWLRTYADPEFDALGNWMREHLDRQADDLSPAAIARLHEIFRISTCYEWLFWEMAWRREEWPA
jgi:thiaminase/transcriptional activator TenA